MRSLVANTAATCWRCEGDDDGGGRLDGLCTAVRSTAGYLQRQRRRQQDRLRIHLSTSPHQSPPGISRVLVISFWVPLCLQCFDTVGWASGRASFLQKLSDEVLVWFYLCGARCRLFAYGPADAAAIPQPHYLLSRINPDWYYFSGTCLPRLKWKRGR